MNNYYETKAYRDRRNDAPVSVYVLDDTGKKNLEKISCIYCKRTIWDMYGRIDKMIVTPMPIEDFGAAINIQCKQCKQSYRLLINAKC